MKRPERIETVVLNTALRWSSLQVQHHHRVWRTKKMRPRGSPVFKVNGRPLVQLPNFARFSLDKANKL